MYGQASGPRYDKFLLDGMTSLIEIYTLLILSYFVIAIHISCTMY